MPHVTLSLEEVASYLHLTPADIERLLRETDIPHSIRGGRTVFPRAEIDAWASQRILGAPDRRLDWYHERTVRATQRIFPDLALMPALLQPAHIDLALASKTRASVLRDMVALAQRTDRVFDPKDLLRSLEEREAVGSTGLPGGLAILHARHQAEFRFEGTFLLLGRTIQPVPFGAPDGRPTRLFFLLCCDDDRVHLHVLARICMLAVKTDFVERLQYVDSAAAACDVLAGCEQLLLHGHPV